MEKCVTKSAMCRIIMITQRKGYFLGAFARSVYSIGDTGPLEFCDRLMIDLKDGGRGANNRRDGKVKCRMSMEEQTLTRVQ